MFSDNLKAARQAKGLSQEELAGRLHVVRQTVSKWERGLSVPDAETLVHVSEVLEVSVASLLGATSSDAEAPVDGAPADDRLAIQLANLNEQLAIQNRRRHRIWVTVVVVLAVWVILCVVLFLSSYVIFAPSAF